MTTLSPLEPVSFEWQTSYDPDHEDSVIYQLWYGVEADSVRFMTADTTLVVQLDTIFYQNEADYSISWWVQAISNEDTVECDKRFSFSVSASGIEESEDHEPAVFGIRKVYPNPFNATINISFGLRIRENVSIQVYDCTGKLASTIIDGQKPAGYHSVIWNASTYPGGLYFVKVVSANSTDIKKIVLVK